MNTHAESSTRSQDRWFTLARLAWVFTFVATLVIFFAFNFRPAVLKIGFSEADRAALGLLDLAPEVAARVDFTLDVLIAAALLVAGLVSFGVAAVLFGRKSGDRMALIVSFSILSLGTFLNADWIDGLAAFNPAWATVAWNLYTPVLEGIFVLLFSLFPDGRFVPPWTRWLMLAYAPWAAVSILVPALRVGGVQISPLALVWYLAPAFLVLAAQVYRFVRVSGPSQRQQTKMIVVSLAAWVPLNTLLSLPWENWLTAPAAIVFVWGARRIGWYLGLLILPISLGIAILRYRLYDIDIIIRRTLQYSVISGLLGLTYFGLVVALQSLFSTISNQQSPIVVVLSTLAIAALFNPVRRRVQDWIDRRFYRKKYDAAKVIADFAATCRDETDLDKLTARLVEVVQETMQPESVTLWLKPTADRRGRTVEGGGQITGVVRESVPTWGNDGDERG